MTNELIPVLTNENQEQVVNGRMLHEFLGVGTEYAKWFSRMCEYGFTENVDFLVIVKNDENYQGGRPSTDHIIKLDNESFNNFTDHQSGKPDQPFCARNFHSTSLSNTVALHHREDSLVYDRTLELNQASYSGYQREC